MTPHQRILAVYLFHLNVRESKILHQGGLALVICLQQKNKGYEYGNERKTCGETLKELDLPVKVCPQDIPLIVAVTERRDGRYGRLLFVVENLHEYLSGPVLIEYHLDI